MFIYPAPEAGLVLLLCLVWVILEMRKKTAKERKARRQERLETNRAQIRENTKAIKESYRKIPTVVKIVVGLTVIFLAYVILVLCFF